MKVDVITPESFMGDIVGDLNAKRGIIKEMNDRGEGNARVKEVTAEVPLGQHVRLRDPDALDDPGPRQLLHGIRPLRGSPAQCRRRDHGCQSPKGRKIASKVLSNNPG